MEFRRLLSTAFHRNAAHILPSFIPQFRGTVPDISLPQSQLARIFHTFVVSTIFPLRTRYPIPTPFSSAAITLLTLLVSSWVNYDQFRDLAENNEFFTLDKKCRLDRFDYIVVGAGAAGMVIATRLANYSRSLSVLLLEAGGEPFFMNDVPTLDILLSNHPGNTWEYKSPPQLNSSQGCDGKRTPTSRGKMLGGSSGVNFMLYARGNKEDFNRWAEDVNDTAWNYDNVLPYFKKSEDYQGAYRDKSTSRSYHGVGGLLNVGTHDYMPGVEAFLAAGVEKGYTIGDYNGENQAVFSKIDVTTRQGWRESTYHAFYRDTGKPRNLCIKKYAHVTKVDIVPEGGRQRAIGVTYVRHDITRHVRAKKEVILAGGTMGSAKLLLLSGVGPKEDLEAMEIPVKKDLPVGKNLQDHVYTIAGPFLTGPSLNPQRDLTINQLTRFLLKGKGLPAAPAGFSGHAFLQSPFAQPPYPDIQILPFSFSLYPELPQHLNRIVGLKTEMLQKWLEPYHLQHWDAKLVVIILGRPKSTGKLSLYSSDPNDNPIVDPKYLSHPDDSNALLWAFKKVVDLYENTTSLNVPLFRKPLPGCHKEKFKSDDYYKCVIKHISGSFYHHVATCALGQVVDSHLRVKGVDGLRVADASVMMRTPNANTYAASVMIGEKGADLIMQDVSISEGRLPHK